VLVDLLVDLVRVGQRLAGRLPASGQFLGLALALGDLQPGLRAGRDDGLDLVQRLRREVSLHVRVQGLGRRKGVRLVLGQRVVVQRGQRFLGQNLEVHGYPPGSRRCVYRNMPLHAGLRPGVLRLLAGS
jgi:hypothetical protein